MPIRRDFVLLLILPSVLAAPTLGQTPAKMPAETATSGVASTPDLSGIWWHPYLPGMEPLASGPTSLRNLSRRKGVSNYDQLVGDYTNPILQPWAADVVRKFGELSKAGVMYPSPANQCWPEPLPYIYKNTGLLLQQQPHQVTLVYNHEFRQVRLNGSHPAKVTPSWHGDAVGRYEGDTLVVDTLGQKHGPCAMLDLYGTPYSEKLHVVERYRLIDYDEAKDGLERNAKENMPAGGAPELDRNYRGKYLQVLFTVEDVDVFTMPWSATITYGRGSNEWRESVCAENPHDYLSNRDVEVPTAGRPDF
jgi:hypothetical protein